MTGKNGWTGISFETSQEMGEAILEDWLTASGDNSVQVAYAFSLAPLRSIISEILDDWDLTEEQVDSLTPDALTAIRAKFEAQQ